jgi:hypothetical protein
MGHKKLNRRPYFRGGVVQGSCFFFGPDQDELAYPVHRMVLETTSRNQGSELFGATMIPQMAVVADLNRSED